MQLAILGAGIQAKAILDDFLRFSEAERVGIADRDQSQLDALVQHARDPRAVPALLDVTDQDAVARWLRDYDAVLSAVPYRYNVALARAAIEAGTHFGDLGGNNDVVRAELALDAAARARGVTIVPDLGLAPGMAGLLGADLVRTLDSCRSLTIRVGGLPREPRPPLNYRLFFAVTGLINEYIEPCRILRQGKLEIVPGLSELEELEFPAPYGKLEAFQTSGGTSTLVETFAGKLEELSYKTIRYPGHCRELRLLADLSFLAADPIDVDGERVSPRRVTETLFERRLSEPTPDVVLVRIAVEGKHAGKPVRIIEELVEYGDAERGLSAMARTTGYPAAIVVRLMAEGALPPGAHPQENVVPAARFREELRRHDINVMRRTEAA